MQKNFIKEDYLSELNEPQQQAVIQANGPVMIIAGAGSGKTRVLTYRIAHLLKLGIDPFNILALTFTNKAAREMKNRIERIAGDEARNLWMGTFHSVFARVLRIESEKLGYPSNFTIYDTDDAKSLIKDILKEQGLDDKIYKPSSVLGRISSAKNNLINWVAYAEDVDLVNHDIQSMRPKMGLLYELYSKRCFKAGAMDFDDLIFNTYVLLKKFPEALYKYQSKFQYVMVDEFQDTNFAQYAIVKKLSARHENICVVGDDAQSIYAFRGANIQNILSFEKDYPDLKTFKLEQNYRSTQNIVNAANSVIANNKHQLEKNVWTDNVEGDKIKVLRAMSDNEEGNMVANTVFQDINTFHYNHKEIAVLYRTNAQSRSIEEALRRSGIPYRIYGGLSFYSRKEIKDMLAYFRLTINHNDEEALKRIINFPKREIGKTTMDRLILAADKYSKSLWEVIEYVHDLCPEINAPTRNRIVEFATMIRAFAVVAKTKDAYDAASHITGSSGLLKELYTDKTPEGVNRFENVQELLNGIKEFTATGRSAVPAPEIIDTTTGEIMRTLEMFMQDIALLTDADDKADGNDDKVSLMTIHAAKGLEFKAVFVVGMEENLFPSLMSMESRADMEEERRLFYVSITRAEQKLYLLHALSRYRYGNLVYNEPSRFLEEIDSQYVDQQFAKDKSIDDDDDQKGNWNSFGKSSFTPSFNSFSKIKFKPKSQTPSPPVTTSVRVPSNFKKISGSGNGNIIEGDNTDNIVPGMEVEHARFGVGKVLAVEGKSPDTKCTIFFQGQGQKQLLLKYAKLKILG